MALSIEQFEILPTDEIHGIVSDWYKDLNGVRPRQFSRDDRTALLAWIQGEITNPTPMDEDDSYEGEWHKEEIEEDL